MQVPGCLPWPCPKSTPHLQNTLRSLSSVRGSAAGGQSAAHVPCSLPCPVSAPFSTSSGGLFGSVVTGVRNQGGPHLLDGAPLLRLAPCKGAGSAKKQSAWRQPRAAY